MVEEYRKLGIREQIIFLVMMGLTIFIFIKFNIFQNGFFNNIIALIGSGAVLVLMASPALKIILKLRNCTLNFNNKFYILNYFNLLRYKVFRTSKYKEIKISIFKLKEKRAINIGRFLYKYFKGYNFMYFVNKGRTNSDFKNIKNIRNEYEFNKGNNNIIAFLNSYIEPNEKLLKNYGKANIFKAKEGEFLDISKIKELEKIYGSYSEFTFLVSGRVYLNIQLGLEIQYLIENKRVEKIKLFEYSKEENRYKEEEIYVRNE